MGVNQTIRIKQFFILFALIIWTQMQGQTIYRTRVFQPNIKTLQIGLQGQRFVLPVLTLNGSEKLVVSFDEMSHDAHSYSYRVIHCNADWTQSSLNTSEYLSGFPSSSITDAQVSLNTTFLYTHYAFSLPNDDMSFKVSGNYVLQIYEDNQQDAPIAQACFSIVEPRVSISAKVRGNTDTELSGSLQQLDFDLNFGGYMVRDPGTEIKAIVRQNNRTDNEVRDLQPTYFGAGKLSYINNRALIFDGGAEYHRFDISNVYAAGAGLDRIKYNRPHYEAYLNEDRIMADKPYQQDMDVNGKFVINVQNSDADSIEADYMNVNFFLPVKSPFFDGQLYLGGEFNHNLMDDTNRLKYDGETGMYYQSILLKQGGYNYQYWFVPKGGQSATTRRVEGSYWQTQNKYSIYIYHRGWGERYDKLIGVKDIE